MEFYRTRTKCWVVQSIKDFGIDENFEKRFRTPKVWLGDKKRFFAVNSMRIK
jgi:hypothetical protein